MTLQILLESERTTWQEETQKQILNSLVCKSHNYKHLGTNGTRLVMVFGRSHAGKTTLILSLLGVKDVLLNQLNGILRAGIPEGRSSTSTAIIYQISKDDKFGICEKGINEFTESNIITYEEESFIERLNQIRNDVEKGIRGSRKILYLYIPQLYFAEAKREDICILDGKR